MRADDARRAELDEGFAIRSAEDAARELGQMKGAVMKLGQMVSFVSDALPPEAQAALAQLQSDAPPMAPSLAAEVVRSELGADPADVFASVGAGAGGRRVDRAGAPAPGWPTVERWP